MWSLTRAGCRGGGIYRGRDELFRFYRGWFGSWEAFEVIPGRIIDFGDRVLVLHTVRGQGKVSGVTVEMPAADLYTLRAGKIVALQGFVSHATALEAARLGE